jgi:hypothetical protein
MLDSLRNPSGQPLLAQLRGFDPDFRNRGVVSAWRTRGETRGRVEKRS